MSTTELKAGPELSIYHVAELKPVWWAALGAERIQLDLSEVSEIDGAGVQLTLAFWHAAKLRGGVLTVVGMSSAAQEAFALVGASNLFLAPTEPSETAHA